MEQQFPPLAARGVDLGLLEVRGDDARSWLQGQVTADIGLAKPGTATYALAVNAQGKILSDMWVLDRGQALTLVVEPPYLEPLRVHLDRFIVMDDVELDAHVERAFAIEGEAPFDAGEWPVRWWGPEGCLSFTDPGLVTVSEERWEAERVRRGVPRMGVDFGEHTLPQEAGLRSAVSFSKGCYVGQEPIVMLEHRGKPPRRLVHGRLPGAVAAGAELANAAGKGRVTSVATHPEGTFVIALVARKALELGAPLVCQGVPLEDLRVLERA